MATHKLYDIVIKTGEYTGNDGNSKGRYKNIGQIMEKDDGGRFVLMEAVMLSSSLNYIANPEKRETLMCGLYEPRQADGQAAPRQQRQQAPQQGAQSAPQQPSRQAPQRQSSGFDNMDDDIPF